MIWRPLISLSPAAVLGAGCVLIKEYLVPWVPVGQREANAYPGLSGMHSDDGEMLLWKGGAPRAR